MRVVELVKSSVPAGLYGIVGPYPGPTGEPRDVLELASALCGAGAGCVQLRCKGWGDGALLSAARQVKELCDAAGLPLVINDRPDIAALVGAAGVHLGQDDLPLEAARQLVGDQRWVGVSTHDLDQVRRAVDAGADYLGFGPIFATSSKPGALSARGLAQLEEAVLAAGNLPVVAIGGIDRARIEAVMQTGARAAAVISAVSAAPDMDLAARALVESAGKC